MQLADRRHEAKVANKGPRRFVRARFGGYPVHVLGVEHRVREPIEELISVHRLEKAGTAPSNVKHLANRSRTTRAARTFSRRCFPSHGPTGPAPVSRLYVPLPRSASRARRQAPR